MGTHWSRLAELIRADAANLYPSLRAFARASGLSLRTIEALIAGERTHYRDRTIADVEVALEWEPGSVQRVLEGRKPLRLKDPMLARINRAWPQLSDRDRRLLGAVIDAMLD